jgi:hypothetical protein
MKSLTLRHIDNKYSIDYRSEVNDDSNYPALRSVDIYISDDSLKFSHFLKYT